MYFFILRPQAKKQKAEATMRKDLKIGDEVTTIGGLVGRIINIREDTDTLIIETGIDRTKIAVRRWAIAGCNS
jgi:preprotein translocase subunit YajC